MTRLSEDFYLISGRALLLSAACFVLLLRCFFKITENWFLKINAAIHAITTNPYYSLTSHYFEEFI